MPASLAVVVMGRLGSAAGVTSGRLRRCGVRRGVRSPRGERATVGSEALTPIVEIVRDALSHGLPA